MKVDRRLLVKRLAVASIAINKSKRNSGDGDGKDTRDDIFIFANGRAMAANDRVRVSVKGIKGLEVAVPAVPLMEMLKKVGDEVVDLTVESDQLLISAKRKQCGIRIVRDEFVVWKHTLPDRWVRVGEDLLKSIAVASTYCGTDDMSPWVQCIHIWPKGVLACDNYRLYYNKTLVPIDEPILIPAEGASRIPYDDCKAIGVSSGWFHVASDKYVVSVRQMEGIQYPTATILTMLKVGGELLELPETMQHGLVRAQVFDSTESYVNVSISDGKMTLDSHGDSGWYKEVFKMKKGVDLSFRAHPESLKHLLNKSTKIRISDDKSRIKATSGNQTFMLVIYQ